MAKRISDQQRLINAAFAAKSREEVDALIESLSAIRDNRFPPEVKAKPKPRNRGTARPRGGKPAEDNKPSNGSTHFKSTDEGSDESKQTTE